MLTSPAGTRQAAIPACQSPAPALPMDDDDIAGVVAGPGGPKQASG